MSPLSLKRFMFINPLLNARTIIAALTFLIFTTALASATLAQQRSIVNPSFEQPTITGLKFIDENSSPGWNTSHPVVNNCDVGNSNCRPLETWSNGFSGAVSTATGAGIQFPELNAYQNSMIYQTICLTNGESFNYSFLHRGRNSASIPDVARFRIGIPTGLPAGSKAADSYDFNIVEVSTTNNGTVTTAPNGSGTINTPVAAGNGWVRYSGTYVYTGATQLANIGFVAVSSDGGASIGNFIDDWRVNLTPYVEFATGSLSGNETNGTVANPPSIRVGGAVPTGGINLTVQVSGGTATAGQDYSLTATFQPGNATNTATVFVPAGEYDGASAGSIFAVPFSLSSDGIYEFSETVNFVVSSAPGATIASASTCGAAPLTTSSYTINETPTSAIVTVGGRVLSWTGSGVARANVSISNAAGETRTVQTNSFGYYRFQYVSSGETYVFAVQSKRYTFMPTLVSVSTNMTDLNFTSQPE